MKKLNIGWASVDITPERPVYLAGQLYVRVSTHVHDPLTATALVLENGETQMTFVSLDTIASLEDNVGVRVRELLRENDEIDETMIDFHALHTHNSTLFGPVGNEGVVRYFGEDAVKPVAVPENIFAGEEATQWITEKLYHLILKAWENRKPGAISFAEDYAAVGFNRRPMFRMDNGKEETKMYGDCSKDNFLRFEGTVDHTADMLYTWDENRNLTGVAVDIPCPAQVHELHCYISADYWASAREHIRKKQGNIYVLPICGAAGDQNPLDLVRISKTNQEALIRWNAQAEEVYRNIDLGRTCDRIGRRIADAVARGYETAQNELDSAPVFKTKALEVMLPIRKVTREDYEEAKAFLDVEKQKYSKEHPMTIYDRIRVYEPMGVVARWEVQQRLELLNYDIKMVRLGRNVLVTNPFELFVDYGMQVRARCRADQVFHIQLANGTGGYLPTKAAVEGGGYSSKPASTHVGPEGGSLLVEWMIKEINDFWEN